MPRTGPSLYGLRKCGRASLYGFLYSLERFCLEFLRGDYAEPWLFGFTSAQATSAGFMLVCLGFFLYFGYLAKHDPERMMAPPDHHLGGK